MVVVTAGDGGRCSSWLLLLVVVVFTALCGGILVVFLVFTDGFGTKGARLGAKGCGSGSHGVDKRLWMRLEGAARLRGRL